MRHKNIIKKLPVEYKYLGFIMSLPLLDGVFISIILTGGLTSYIDAILIGCFVIGGGASIGVILSKFENDINIEIKRTIIIGLFISILAIIQAATVQMIEPFLNIDRVTYGAMIALLALAYKISPIKKTIWFIEPGIIILITIIFSINIQQPIEYNIIIDYYTAWYAFIACTIATSISIITIIYKNKLNNLINKKSIQYVTSFGLIAITLNIGSLIPDYIPIIIFVFGFIISVLINN